jgi:phage/plasmid-associated DNA primase
LELLVGDDNCHSSSLESICENRFELANFYNKRLVVCPDEDRRIRGFSNFKKATGGDYLRGEEKNMKAFRFQFQGLIVLASNKPVFVGDSSYGLAQRLIPIPFDTTIPEGKQRNLEPEFKADLPAFTTYLLNIDRDWVTQTLKQAKQIESVKKLEWELTIRTDSIAAFYDDKLIADPGVEVLSASLFEAYREYCAKKGFSPQHENNFCPSLVELCKDKLQQEVSSYKTRKGKAIKGVRFRVDSDWVEEGDGVTAVTAVTAKNQNSEFSIATASPKPPTVDRPIPETTKVNDYVEYLIVDGEVKWLEIYFHKHAIAKAWVKHMTMWGCKTSDLKKLDRKTESGDKWLLIVKGLTIARLEMLLRVDLQQWPQALSRRK